MTEVETNAALDAHKKFAIDLFNHAWSLFDKQDRTPDDDDEMINAAHASAFHWWMLKGEIDETRWLQSTPRSHNQLANVYIKLKRNEPALYHAKRCVDLCIERGIADFDIAFGYECLARALELDGNTEERDKATKLAKEAGEAIEKVEDKEFFLTELKKLSWI